MVPADSHRIPRVPRYSGCRYASYRFVYATLMLCGHTFQNIPFPVWVPHHGPTTPAMRRHTAGLGSSPVARHYWGNHVCFLFLRVLRCFSSPGWPLYRDSRSSTCWVVPFGYPRITGHLHLPAACRSLSRPSSPVRAKASAIRPCLLSSLVRM